MLMVQSLNAGIFILGTLLAFLLKWGLWAKGRPAGAPLRPYLRENIGDHMTSVAVVVVVMVLWLSGKLSGVAVGLKGILPESLTFGDQIEIAAWSSLLAGLISELSAPALVRWVISKIPGLGTTTPVLLLLLLATPAMASSDYWQKAAEKPRQAGGGLFFEGSFFGLGSERSTLSCPRLDVSSDIKGFALGGGWDFKSGYSLGLQWMHGREELRFNSVSSNRSRDGYMVTGRMTWQAAKRLGQRICCCKKGNQ